MKPLIASALFGILMMFAALSVKERQTFTKFAIALLSILTAINIWELTEFLSVGTQEFYFNDMIRVESVGLWFFTLMSGITLLYVLLSGKYIEKVGLHTGEYYALIFFILTGAYLMCSFNNLLILFLAIEIMSIPQYVLAGSDKRNLKSSEASLKYFLMGAFSTGILLMGITLIYGAMGTFNITHINFSQESNALIMPLAGVLLLIIAFGFKISAAPMHFWTPDVYDGSPTPFTSYMATVVKATIFFGFLSIFKNSFNTISDHWHTVLAIVTCLTLLIGNITAVYQQSVKRMLAYSSIAQAGFMLFTVLAINAMALKGIIIYGVAYSVATIGMFAILMKMKDFTYDGFNGLAKKSPFLAFMATIFLLSLAGIPLTAGFFAKYFVITALLEQSAANVWLVIFALLMAAVSVYYYFKVIMAMYFKTGEPILTDNVTFADKVWLSIAAIIIILLGVYPDMLLFWV